jgi:hypothetical protein
VHKQHLDPGEFSDSPDSGWGNTLLAINLKAIRLSISGLFGWWGKWGK